MVSIVNMVPKVVPVSTAIKNTNKCRSRKMLWSGLMILRGGDTTTASLVPIVEVLYVAIAPEPFVVVMVIALVLGPLTTTLLLLGNRQT